MQTVHGRVVIQIELGLETKRLGSCKCVSAAVLGVKQKVVLEAAHEDPIFVVLEKEALGAIQQMAEALRISDAAAIVRDHGSHILAAGEVLHRLAGLKPSSESMPRHGG